MNKQKYLVMGLTFLILIAVTPLIFSKLMNSKLNKMVEGLNKDGYKINLVEDKSSYLKTDKVFLAEISGEKLNNNFIGNLKFKIEILFNNLPVTRVDFKGVLEKINLIQKEYNDDINKLLKNKIKFFATTPNFKVYNYKLENIDLSFNNLGIEIKGIKGIFEYSNVKSNKLNIDDIVFKDKTLLIEMKNLKNSSFYEKNGIKNENRFDFYVKAGNNNIQIKNVKISTNSLIDKKTSVLSHIFFDKFISPAFLNVENFILNLNLLNLDTATLIALSKEVYPKNRNRLSLELLKKGFDVKLISKAKNIEAMKNKLGYYFIDAKLNVLPDDNLEKDLQNNNLKFLISTIHYESTPEVAALFMNLFPQSAFVFALAKKENSKVVLDLSLKDSKLLVNGKEVE